MSLTLRPAAEADVEPLLALVDSVVAWLVARGRAGQWGSASMSESPRFRRRTADRLVHPRPRRALDRHRPPASMTRVHRPTTGRGLRDPEEIGGGTGIIANGLTSSWTGLSGNDHAMQAGRGPDRPRGQPFRRREFVLIAVGIPCVVAAAVLAGLEARGTAHVAEFILQVLGVAFLVGAVARWRDARRRK